MQVQRVASSNLAYPRLATCSIGFAGGPSSISPLSLPPLPPAMSASELALDFSLENSVLRSTGDIKMTMAADQSQRASRKQAREKEAAAAAKLDAERRKREEEAAAEQRRKDEEARRRVAMPVAQPVASPSQASAAASTPSHVAFHRSFRELSGVSDDASISELLALLNYDLDRAIGIFFADNPPTMQAALEKARSVAQAHQTQGQQQQHHQQQPQQAAQPSYEPPRPQPSPSPSGGYSTQLTIQLPDGSSVLISCASKDTFWTLYERLSPSLSSRPALANKPINFALTCYPHTSYEEEKWNTTLMAAGLVPSGTLRVHLSR